MKSAEKQHKSSAICFQQKGREGLGKVYSEYLHVQINFVCIESQMFDFVEFSIMIYFYYTCHTPSL